MKGCYPQGFSSNLHSFVILSKDESSSPFCNVTLIVFDPACLSPNMTDMFLSTSETFPVSYLCLDLECLQDFI